EIIRLAQNDRLTTEGNCNQCASSERLTGIGVIPSKACAAKSWMKLLQVSQEFTGIASLPLEVQRVQRDSPILPLASSEDFCNIVRTFVYRTKRRGPSTWPKRKKRALIHSRQIFQSQWSMLRL